MDLEKSASQQVKPEVSSDHENLETLESRYVDNYHGITFHTCLVYLVSPKTSQTETRY